MAGTEVAVLEGPALRPAAQVCHRLRCKFAELSHRKRAASARGGGGWCVQTGAEQQVVT